MMPDFPKLTQQYCAISNIITPETESSIKENSDNLDNGIKTMILESIDKLSGKEKRPDIDSIFDFGGYKY